MRRAIAALLLITSGSGFAHQPIMDMAPRWNDGYGIQSRLEHANGEDTTWLEGVYTFKPSLRMTLKLPWENGELGDALFAVPLKRYNNSGAFTSNWGFTPSVRVPTGGGSQWDPGLSISYSSETPRAYQLYDLYALDDVIGLDINVGRVFPSGRGSSWFALWDVSAVESSGGERVLSGPVVVYFQGNTVFRAEYKALVHDNDDNWEGNFLNIGIGWVY